jgi:hypothetical protein
MKDLYMKDVLGHDNDLENHSTFLMIKEWFLCSVFFGKVLIVSGPQSSGKSTLAFKMLEHFPNFSTINRNKIIQDVTNQVFGDCFAEASNITNQQINSFLHLNSIISESLPLEKKDQFLYLKHKIEAVISQKKQKFLMDIFSKYYIEIKKFILSGINVIIDEGLIHLDEEYSIFKYCCGNYKNIKIMLLFNTMEENLTKCIVRNNKFLDLLSTNESLYDSIRKIDEQEISSGNSMSSYRSPLKIIKNYKEFYCFDTYVNTEKSILSEISRNSTNDLFLKVCNEELKLLSALNQGNKLKLEVPFDMEQELNSIFKNSNVAYITSKIKFDFIIPASKIPTLDLLENVSFLNNLLKDIIPWLSSYDDTINASDGYHETCGLSGDNSFEMVMEKS